MSEHRSEEFFRFPQTPHLAWLGRGAPRGDKILGPDEARAILSRDLVVEEKVDGANLGLSVDGSGVLRAQNRGAYITTDHTPPQFKTLERWLAPKRDDIAAALFPDLVLFGEWCYAVHSVRYTRLPDWFLAFDVYDRVERVFWSAARRDALLAELGIAPVPKLGSGRFDLPGLVGLLGRSELAEGPAEGLYVRAEDGQHLLARAKLVRAEFVQAIDEHWSRRALEKNSLRAR